MKLRERGALIRRGDLLSQSTKRDKREEDSSDLINERKGDIIKEPKSQSKDQGSYSMNS